MNHIGIFINKSSYNLGMTPNQIGLLTVLIAGVILVSGCPLAPPSDGGGLTGPIDCGTDFDCFIEASEDCKLAKVEHTAVINLFGVEQTGIFDYELKGKEADNCIFYLKSREMDIKFSDEVVQQMLASGATQEEIDGQEQILNEQVDVFEGLDGTCKFNTAELASMLRRWSEGSYSTSDLEDAECEGDYFDQLGSPAFG